MHFNADFQDARMLQRKDWYRELAFDLMEAAQLRQLFANVLLNRKCLRASPCCCSLAL